MGVGGYPSGKGRDRPGDVRRVEGVHGSDPGWGLRGGPCPSVPGVRTRYFLRQLTYYPPRKMSRGSGVYLGT